MAQAFICCNGLLGGARSRCRRYPIVRVTVTTELDRIELIVMAVRTYSERL